MSQLEMKTRVLPGGRIELQSPELIEGQIVTVRIVLKDDDQSVKKSFLEILGDYKGGQLFKSVEEVDQYIKEERDSWGD